jgi:methyl-accepting chemotaxis protein
MNTLVGQKIQIAKNTSDSNTALAKKAVGTTIVLLIAGMLLAAFLGMLIANIIGNPLRKLASVADDIAKGDLSASIPVHAKDETGQLAGAFESVINCLRDLVSQAESVADAAIDGKLETRADVSRLQGGY